MKPLTIGSLFSGIGGFEKGLEDVKHEDGSPAFETKWQVEINDYCQKVLRKHWTGTTLWDDIRTFPPEGDSTEHWNVDIITGGFPCTDISLAGQGAGLDGEQSSLFFELARVVRVLGPRFVVLENSPALIVRGLDRVLGTFAELGFDAEWRIISAREFGAPHIRKRIWIVAYPNSNSLRIEPGWFAGSRGQGTPFVGSDGTLREVDPDTHSIGCEGESELHSQLSRGQHSETRSDPNGLRNDVPNSSIEGLPLPEQEELCGTGRGQEGRATAERGWWSSESGIRRVAPRLPNRTHRLRALGNSIVPQIATWIGKRILEASK